MTDEPKEKRRGRVRRILRPRMPWQRSTGIGSSWNIATSALNRTKALCPNCQNGRLRVSDAYEHDEDDHATPLLVCTSCDFTQNISTELENAAAIISNLRIGERRFLIAALCAFAIGIIYLIVADALATMIGITMISILLFANAIVFRYRAWQVANDKLYQVKAPIGAWLRYEFSKNSE